MKYYAVTEDPNELLHYGVKGMKWGKHLFGDDLKPKSTAYKNAAKKLKSLASSVTKAVNNTKNAIQKSSVQRSINKQKKQEEKFNEAVAKTQRRIDTISNLNNLNKLTSYEKSVEQQYKADQKQAKANLKAEKAAIKREKKYAKNERKMERFMQEAREGRLKYGQLSDEQVQRVTDRLALERSARSLGSTEKPKFRKRMKEALQEGLLQGVTQGTAAGMREIAIAKVQNRLSNKRALDKKAEQQAERDRKTARIKNKKTNKEIREDIKQEAYEAQIENGVGYWDRTLGRHMTTKRAATVIKNLENKNHEEDRVRRIADETKNERDREYYKLEESGDYDINNVMDLRAKYQDAFGVDDMHARFGKNNGKYNKLSDEEKRNIVLAINKTNTENKNEEAYNVIAKQQQDENNRQQKIKDQEQQNAKLKEQYDSDMEQYRKEKKEIEEDNKRIKDAYDSDMEKYNKAVSDYNEQMREWNNANRIYTAKISYGDMSAQDPGPKPQLTAQRPDKPDYRSIPSEPKKPKYIKIDYSTPASTMPSYAQYQRLRSIGINALPSGGGNGKKKGNKNN